MWQASASRGSLSAWRARSTRSPATRRASRVGLGRASRTSAPARRAARSSVCSITAAIVEEAEPPAEERVHRDLVGGVQRARRRAARLGRLAGERAGTGTSRSSTGSNVSAPSSTRSSGRDRHVDALGVVQRVGDRHAHVRVAEVGERRAVAQADQAVDDRLRVHDDVDPLVRDAEQVVGLDQLEPLVHQRRRVDRDLAAHPQVGMRERLVDGDVARARPACARGMGRRRRSGSAGRPSRAARRRAAGAAPSARSRPG